MKQRAAFFDDANWSNATRTEYTRFGRRFFAAARKGEQNDLTPDIHWLTAHAKAFRQRYGAAYTKRYVNAIQHHLLQNGAPDLTVHPAIEATLYGPDDIDPFSTDFISQKVPPRFRKRVQYFSDSGKAAGTLSQFHRHLEKYTEACVQCGFDSKSPAQTWVDDYFEALAKKYTFCTVRNIKCAISAFFRKHKVPDLTRSLEIKRTLDGLERAKPPRRTEPYSVEERFAILTAFGERPLDVRDRVLLLLVSFSRYTPEDAVLIRAEDCHLMADGVLIDSEDRKRFPNDTFIGGHSHRDFDIRVWLPRLLDLIGGSGPLLQPLHPRGGLSGTPMHPVVSGKAIRAAALRAKVAPTEAAARLKALHEREAVEERGLVITTHHLGKKKIESRRMGEAQRAELIAAKSLRDPFHASRSSRRPRSRSA